MVIAGPVVSAGGCGAGAAAPPPQEAAKDMTMARMPM
jgi:hypothetical protein